ncbi:uncharacterized protein LOC9301464 isoform X3 [Arabidopsis lyrata subsp. lyrata]|uniref:uncharacterized protein LOC9301464 isoform X3 n=1 Tax=Arabidopsis lyrata subsp. lyrata TaxID=81972 RepID=UPI000A29D922|nr:uncharacterized protein LOC9301464 isoform X3 [Arabidopsis lyrata subsp. lyrata]|eukprot:XP_002865390.2 uncharacterized protein LOC9301464 isoform X3 [Arabidopsis lyrata subsp. lyrata]
MGSVSRPRSDSELGFSRLLVLSVALFFCSDCFSFAGLLVFSVVRLIRSWVCSLLRGLKLFIKEGDEAERKRRKRFQILIRFGSSRVPKRMVRQSILMQLKRLERQLRWRVMISPQQPIQKKMVKSKCMAQMEEKQLHLQRKVDDLEAVIANYQRGDAEVGENSAPRILSLRAQAQILLISVN